MMLPDSRQLSGKQRDVDTYIVFLCPETDVSDNTWRLTHG